MSLVTRYSDPRGADEPAAYVSLGSNVRFGELGLALRAAAGDVGTSTVDLEDPGGIYTFVGLRAFDVSETSAASNNDVIGRFVMQDRSVKRSKERGLLVGADRLWSVDLTDYNWHLNKRIIVDSDANRPAESAGSRINWLLTQASTINLKDYGHVTYPSTMLDANDYRGYRAADVLIDAALEDQYNFFCRFNEAHGRPELYFFDPNGDSDTSTLIVSNVEEDASSGFAFAPFIDAELKRSPSRIAYGVYLPFNGGAIYVRNDLTGQQFGNLDQAAPMATVHTAAKARRIANAFLNANDSETDVLTYTIRVPVAQVNDLREGQRHPVTFTHLPGYETQRYVRVVGRNVRQTEEGGGAVFDIDYESIPCGTASGSQSGDFTGDVFAGIQRSTDDNSAGTQHGILDYAATYDAPVSGWDTQATTGPISQNAASGLGHYSGFTVSQAMTVRIYARALYSGNIGHVNVTLYVKVNGAIVASATQTAYQAYCKVDLRNYHLEAGDVVTVTGGPSSTFWTNTGLNGTQFIVGRGTFNNVNLTADGSKFVGP